MTRGYHDVEPAAAARVAGVVAAARRRWFFKVWLRVATEVALVAAVTVVAAWSLTLLAPLQPGLLLLAGVAALGLIVAFLVARAWPFWQRPDDRRVARFVEEHVPELEDVAASAVDCLRQTPPPAFADLLLGAAATRLDALDLDRVVPARTLRRRALEFAGASALLVAAFVLARAPLLQTWDLLRMAIRPPVIVIEVTPGDQQVREGSDVRLRARAMGLPERLPREPLVVLIEQAGRRRELPMASGDAEDADGAGRWQAASVDDARASFTYRVAGHRTTSRAYRVDVRPRPRVSRIDVHYRFPSFSGLAPRVDEASGDIYAPAGTRVRLVVHTTVPVLAADMGLSSGSTVALAPQPSQTLEARMTVTKDDAYRLTLVESDGSRTPDDTEYFVRTVDDRPPDVRILRPAGDRKVTRLEEVIIEAQADDDFGVDRLEIVYAARGGAEKIVRLGAPRGVTATGRHTLFVEDLDVQPGDFVSYYARAVDVGRGKRPTETQSDIFFLEVRPFNEEFEAAQSSAMGGGGGGAVDDLAARQKELIIATWKLERRAVAGRSADDIRALARAQAELKAKTEELANRMAPRAAQRRPRPGQPGGQTPAVAQSPDPMRRAVEAMERSRAALEALQTGPAIPHEMEALNQLLKAQAEIQRRQVTQQQSASGRGGQTGNQDLSALFDRELQRQQQTKYENRSSVEEAQEAPDSSEALDRLRDLARRQDELSQRQQELRRRQAQLAAEEVKRQLEKLTREQEELRRQAEQLAAQLQQQQGEQSENGQSGQQGSRTGQRGGARSDSQSVEAAAEAMQQSRGGLEREELEEAAKQAQQAAERLRQAERSLEGQQPDETARSVGDMQLEAAQIAESERRVSRQLRDDGNAARDELRQMAGEQERSADRAARLAARARGLGAADERTTPGPSGSGGGSRQDVARSLADPRIESELRASARALRELADRPGTGAGGEGQEQSEAARADELARTLEAAARKLGQAAGKSGDRSSLSEQLARAGELRDRLSQLTRQLREGGRQPGRSNETGPRPQDGQPSPTPGAGGEQRQASGEQPSSSGETGQTSSPQGRGSGGQGSGTADGMPGPDEVARELRALERLAEGLGEEGDRLRQALQSLHGYAPSRSAPGTESWKQDFSRWESLRREIGASLEHYVAVVSGRLQAEENEDRLDAGASDAAPDAYRSEVARYYRSLARKPPS